MFYAVQFVKHFTFITLGQTRTNPDGPGQNPERPGQTRTDSNKSLLQPYQISNVEVLDYQLAALRTEFIRPSFYKIIFQKRKLISLKVKSSEVQQVSFRAF